MLIKNKHILANCILIFSLHHKEQTQKVLLVPRDAPPAAARLNSTAKYKFEDNNLTLRNSSYSPPAQIPVNLL